MCRVSETHLVESEHSFMLQHQIGQILSESKSDHSGASSCACLKAEIMPNLVSLSHHLAEKILKNEIVLYNQNSRYLARRSQMWNFNIHVELLP